jgi:hypothetical protein
MKTAHIILCVAAMTPALLMAQQPVGTTVPDPKSDVVAAPVVPQPTVPPPIPPTAPRLSALPGYPGTLKVDRDADNKIVKMELVVNEKRSHVIKLDEQSLKMAENATNKRVRILGKIVEEIEGSVTNKFLKVDGYRIAPPQGVRPRVVDVSGMKDEKAPPPQPVVPPAPAPATGADNEKQ